MLIMQDKEIFDQTLNKNIISTLINALKLKNIFKKIKIKKKKRKEKLIHMNYNVNEK